MSAIDRQNKLVAKKSAGLLMFRRRNSTVELLLVHPGGPFWAKKDAGRGRYQRANTKNPTIRLKQQSANLEKKPAFRRASRFLRSER